MIGKKSMPGTCKVHATVVQSWNKESCLMTWSFAAQSAQFCNHAPSRNHGLPFFITSVHKSINFLLNSSLSVTAASEPLFLCCLNKQKNESLTLNALRPVQQPSFHFTHAVFFFLQCYHCLEDKHNQGAY